MSTEHPKASETPPGPSKRVEAIFKSASEEHKELIREILKEERDVQHMSRRSDIHTKIYDHVRRLIK
tara:strand:- start:16039 stop:16239 length:201 start_codon:yes stop_codon:yes gene_type:complete